MPLALISIHASIICCPISSSNAACTIGYVGGLRRSRGDFSISGVIRHYAAETNSRGWAINDLPSTCQPLLMVARSRQC
jgi:hypothetical protein